MRSFSPFQVTPVINRGFMEGIFNFNRPPASV